LIVANSLLSDNSASFAGGAIFTFALKNKFVIADTVVFTNNTAACCYLQGGIISSSGTCMDVTGGSGDGADECCLANYYSDGEHCQLCTAELTCAGTVGANSSTVAVANGLWRATITASKTYSCWNADACIGGVAASSTDGYCAIGCKGPCMYSILLLLILLSLYVFTLALVLTVTYASVYL
jgi:predicted outer membrane repeat protein